MTPEEMKKRTKTFALRRIRLSENLPNNNPQQDNGQEDNVNATRA